MNRTDYEEFYELHLDELIKVRADMACERCGKRATNAFWFVRSWWGRRQVGSVRGISLGEDVKLAVHHRDGNPENNRLTNLICLCQKCHLYAERLNKRFPQVTLLRYLAVCKLKTETQKT